MGRYLRTVPRWLLEIPRVERRARLRQFRAVPEEAANYPPYYRQTFHWQSDS